MSHLFKRSGFVAAGGGARWRSALDKARDVISIWDYIDVGDGSIDEYADVQAALDAAAGKTLDTTGAICLLESGSPEIHSNTKIIGNGIFIQPNYFTYNRSVDPYVADDVVDWNALWMDVGAVNVEITGIECRGPFYQSSDAGYTANPVQNWPASNGILVRGRDYQKRKGLAPVGESRNIRIHAVTIEGFAEDAVQADNVTGLWVWGNEIARCGRGGVRGYGCYGAWVIDNNITKLYPGDYLNNGNRMYGITFTRVYGGDLSDYRQSEWCFADKNKIKHVPYWKALDTHGGKHISFTNNTVEEAHIGIGVDKGGFDLTAGIAPPEDITITGNKLIRTLADDQLEGDNGRVGAAIFMVAHDQTDAHVGRSIVVSDNNCSGWGEDSRFGAIVYSNWIGVNHHHNNIADSRRAAVCIRERFEGSLDGDVIDNVRASSLVVQDGIAIESANCRGRIGPATFINREATALRAIALADPAAGYGFAVSDEHRFIDDGGGITKVAKPNNDQFGPWTAQLVAAARVNADGAISGSRGVASVVKTAAGTYTVTLERSMVATSSLWPIAGSRGGSVTDAQADAASANTITVLTKDPGGTLTDGSFILHVFGY